MESGKKIKLPEWGGYYFISRNPDNFQLPEEERIWVHTKNGDVQKAGWVDKYRDRDDYEITDGSLGFDFAILALQNRKRVTRKSWNGKGQWVTIIHAGNAMFNLLTVGSWPMKDCLGLKNAQGEMQPGWVPSQGDLFAKDWMLAPAE